MTAKRTYLDRYLAGEHELVWAELQALGAAVRESPLYVEACAVAHETMRRVRQNFELLIPRLHTVGYSFGDEWKWAEARMEGYEEDYLAHRQQLDPVIALPGPDVAAQLTELEMLRGQVPIAVMAWYQVVGSVNFTGLAPESWWRMHWEPSQDSAAVPRIQGGVSEEDFDLDDLQLVERWGHTYWLDPLYLWPLEIAIQSARYYDALLRGEFTVDISRWRDKYIPIIPMGPDMHTKYEYSGGGPVGVRAAGPSMDGLFETDLYQGSFVDYLRLCCRYAGLPELRNLPTWIRERGVPARVERIERDTRYLTEALLSF